jgi:hypothetical protein
MMRFSTYFKEHLLAYDIENKISYKIMEAKQINKNSYLLTVIDRKRKLTTLTLEKSDIKKFKFIKRKHVGRTIIEFEEILCLLNETTTVGAAFGASATTPDQFSSDWYAPNDARNVWGGMPAKVQKRNLKGIESFTKTRKKKNKAKKKKNKSKKKD